MLLIFSHICILIFSVYLFSFNPLMGYIKSKAKSCFVSRTVFRKKLGSYFFRLDFAKLCRVYNILILLVCITDKSVSINNCSRKNKKMDHISLKRPHIKSLKNVLKSVYYEKCVANYFNWEIVFY